MTLSYQTIFYSLDNVKRGDIYLSRTDSGLMDPLQSSLLPGHMGVGDILMAVATDCP